MKLLQAWRDFMKGYFAGYAKDEGRDAECCGIRFSRHADHIKHMFFTHPWHRRQSSNE